MKYDFLNLKCISHLYERTQNISKSHTIWRSCPSVFIIKLLEFIFFPFCMVIFLSLNLLPFKLNFPILDKFTIFQTTSHVYMQISFKFVYIIISQNVFAFLSNLKAYFADWSFSMALRLLTMIFFLIVLGGTVHKQPGPLSFLPLEFG